VSALSPRARERVEDHFKKSFGLSLVPLLPYIRSMEMVSTEKDRLGLEQVRSCVMAP
jgi:hypothetical protein